MEWHFPPGAHGPQDDPGALFYPPRAVLIRAGTRFQIFGRDTPGWAAASAGEHLVKPCAAAAATAVAAGEFSRSSARAAARRRRRSVCLRSAARWAIRLPYSRN